MTNQTRFSLLLLALVSDLPYNLGMRLPTITLILTIDYRVLYNLSLHSLPGRINTSKMLVIIEGRA